MNVKLCCVGKLKERYFLEAEAEYEKRLARYCTVTVLDLPDEKAPETLSEADARRVKDREGERLLARLRPEDFLVALCIGGRQLSSEAFSAFLAERQAAARPLAFAIGGSLGLSDAVLARADAQLSLSPMTFPHRIARLVLLEQIYRGFKILKNEPYHK